ncbi:ribonuclease E/G [Sinorhizobium garamanticum]|uniref:Ribonuclease E n=1 Tax=Sinorhizobium garamanticum TaxID=680247 RepID=A0ABY8D961_9HYPH|nr:ribonuclease E/G [Sinorhizobium garamanticum]WEX87406.1 ribonuclease E/G [Sinorhizobium garamanticum]
MAEKMLIDASHAEETRVVVVRGNRIEEFDFESEHKKQIRGNIYLAKVTRVEPSLQAAFVDYGGNRHGFLAFAEIHPDYYQIPLADRQALLKAEAEEARRDDDIEPVETASEQKPSPVEAEPETVAEVVEASAEAPAEVETVVEKPKAKPKRTRRTKVKAAEEAPETAESQDGGEEGSRGEMAAMVDADSISEDVDTRRRRDDDDDDDDAHDAEKEIIESVGAEDAMEEVPDRHIRKPRKQYRIQEVIKRRQILLVQVAKEERGNKGAALTTYLSLAGRYSVLMPNTARGGGISRKITNLQDRKRLKEIARGLEVPQGMGVILRTAGANRTKVEIKRDFEYLMRLWENVRTLTLNSTAPCLVYEEGSLIKRSIRDLYNKDISEIIVSGEEGYKEAKSFMKMLMPSHAKVVQPYRDVHPIFSRSGIEAQLDRMLQPQVTLKSGGYIIINQTEALVSIDVNSGRSTREHSIEDTALQTNLEAAEEVARQLRLRDLAGLVVIDFIDMEEKRNNRAVEKKLKDCLKNDRARIQVGRISHFGLLEMSRQRIRASVLESTMQTCPHCNGTGHVRSQSSVALHVLRGIEEYLLKNTTHDITVRTIPEIALYLLNQKRGTIMDYEQRFGVSIIIEADAHVGAQHFAIDRGEPVENPVKIEQLLHFEPEPEEEEEDVVIEEDLDEEEAEETAAERPEQAKAQQADDGGRKRKRRRRRRGKGGVQGPEAVAAEADETPESTAGEAEEAEDEHALEGAEAAEDGDQKRKRRRRGKRGGRRNKLETTEGETAGDLAGEDAVAEEAEAAEPVAEEPVAAEAAAVETVSEEAKPAKPKRTRKKAAKADADADEAAQTAVEEQPETVDPATEAVEEAEADLEGAKPARANRDLATIASEPVITSNVSSKTENNDEEPPKPKKGGWWQRRGFF